jgi:hypothetical protein
MIGAQPSERKNVCKIVTLLGEHAKAIIKNCETRRQKAHDLTPEAADNGDISTLTDRPPLGNYRLEYPATENQISRDFTLP